MNYKFDIENNQKILDTFLKSLAKAKNRVLMLDYDGTLAPFKIRREQAEPYIGVCEILDKIMREENTKVIIITGRWTKDIVSLLKLDQTPEIWGSHGVERLKKDGSYELYKFDDETLKDLTAADEWIERNNLNDYCEQKPGCIAVHWRGLDQYRINWLKELVLEKWKIIEKNKHLYVHEFDGGIELRLRHVNKGYAVRKILSEVSWGTVAAYLGDDKTDEDAFKIIKGNGIGILVRNEFRPTEASIWLKPPSELIKFFNNWHKFSGGMKWIY